MFNEYVTTRAVVPAGCRDPVHKDVKVCISARWISLSMPGRQQREQLHEYRRKDYFKTVKFNFCLLFAIK
jgi:hypothetical protein